MIDSAVYGLFVRCMAQPGRAWVGWRKALMERRGDCGYVTHLIVDAAAVEPRYFAVGSRFETDDAPRFWGTFWHVVHDPSVAQAIPSTSVWQ